MNLPTEAFGSVTTARTPSIVGISNVDLGLHFGLRCLN